MTSPGTDGTAKPDARCPGRPTVPADSSGWAPQLAAGGVSTRGRQTRSQGQAEFGHAHGHLLARGAGGPGVAVESLPYAGVLQEAEFWQAQGSLPGPQRQPAA